MKVLTRLMLGRVLSSGEEYLVFHFFVKSKVCQEQLQMSAGSNQCYGFWVMITLGLSPCGTICAVRSSAIHYFPSAIVLSGYNEIRYKSRWLADTPLVCANFLCCSSTFLVSAETSSDPLAASDLYCWSLRVVFCFCPSEQYSTDSWSL